MSATEPNGGEEDDPIEILGELLEEIVEALGLDADVDVELEGDQLTGAVVGEDVGLFIGRHGQTIDAVRHLAQRTLLTAGHTELRIEVDADGYRARRAQVLRGLADDAAREALRGQEPVPLDPMPASERRIVHEHLRDRDDVDTRSDGDEPRRRLVVFPAEE